MSEEKVKDASPREKKESMKVDEQMRMLINKLLNVRMVSPESTDETLDLLEKEWFKFCIKPMSHNSPLGIKSWKKVRPSREAFRIQAIHFIEKFDKAQEEQLNKAPEVSSPPLDYKFK